MDTARSTGCYQCFLGTAPGARPPAPSGVAVLTQPTHILLGSRAVSLLRDLGGHWQSPVDPQSMGDPHPLCHPRELSLSPYPGQFVFALPGGAGGAGIPEHLPVHLRLHVPLVRVLLHQLGELSVDGLGRTACCYQPCTIPACQGGDLSLTAASTTPRMCRNVMEELRNSQEGDQSSSCPTSQRHGAAPGWHGTPRLAWRCPVGPMPLCPFWLLEPLPARQQGAEPRADARHQERDFIL